MRDGRERHRAITGDGLIVVSNDAYVLRNAKSSPQDFRHKGHGHVIVDDAEAGRTLVQAEESPGHLRAAFLIGRWIGEKPLLPKRRSKLLKRSAESAQPEDLRNVRVFGAPRGEVRH